MNQKIIYWLAVQMICCSVSGSEEKTISEKSLDLKTVQVMSEETQKPVSLVLNLKHIGEAISRFNPDLAAARLRIDEARGRARQAGLLPNPVLSTSFEQDPTFRELGTGIGFSQTFPVTSRLRLEKEISKTEVSIAEAEVADVKRQITGEARQMAVRYLALQQQKDLRLQQLRLAMELADYTERVAKKGEGSQLDAAQAKLEANQFEVLIRQLDTSAQQQIGILKPLIGLTPGDTLSLGGTLSEVSMSPVKNLDLNQRKDYVAVELSVDAAGRAVNLEKARKWQDITAGLFAGFLREEDVPIGLEAEQRVGFQISFPLPLWNKNRGAVEERKATKRRLELSLSALDNRIRNEVQTAYLVMRTQAKLASDIETRLIPDSKKQVTDTNLAYRNGQINLLTVLRARDQYLDLQSGLMTAQRDFHLARIRYETALGKTN
jgi:cobalt-zinc-cadmium efflux system outer membrane protein